MECVQKSYKILCILSKHLKSDQSKQTYLCIENPVSITNASGLNYVKSNIGRD